MHRTAVRIMLGLSLLAAIAAAQQLAPTHAAQNHAAPAPAAGPFTVYLPSVASPAQQPPPPPGQGGAGFFALKDWLSYSAATAVDPRGGVHMAMFVSDEGHDSAPLNEPALYSYCPGPASACANPDAWSAPVQFDDHVNEVQVATTPDGHPRLLVRKRGSRFNEYDYYACDSGCTDAAGWSGAFVAEDAGGDLNGFSLGNHYFALDAQGRPRFVYGNAFGNGQPNGIYYAWCDEADCTAAGSWQRALAFVGPSDVTTSGEAASLVFDGDRPRFVISRYTSGLPTGLLYMQCDADCGLTDSWGSAVIPMAGDRAWASWDLALDPAGRPRLALFEPAAIDIAVGGALHYAWCDAADCTQPGAWQRAAVLQGEGMNADLLIDAQGRARVVYDAGQRGVVGEARCDSGCGSPAGWSRRILETNERLMQDFTPASPLTCSQQEVAWLDALPSASLAPDGSVAVAYDAKYVARCYTVDPSDPNHRIYSEVRRVWWAVRWLTFAD